MLFLGTDVLSSQYRSTKRSKVVDSNARSD
jgi:hypothetical protein